VVAFHRPRFSSGYHGDFDAVDPLWRLAVDAGADVVLNGHEHDYERLGPMDAAGHASEDGARVFIVGTGGALLRSIDRRLKTSQVRIDDRHGVLVLELADGAYRWAFHSTPDSTVEDQGRALATEDRPHDGALDQTSLDYVARPAERGAQRTGT
jgi:hypothetical protein